MNSQLNFLEQTGQMLISGFEGTALTTQTEDFIGSHKLGGLILFERNFDEPDQLLELTRDLQKFAKKNLPAPLFISVDQEGGRVSRLGAPFTAFPHPSYLDRTRSETLAQRFGNALANELRAAGVNMVYAPVLDVDSNPDNPIIGRRAFSSTPEWAGKLACAFARGVRSAQVIPVGKHFPGHGDTDRDSHLELPKVQREIQSLEETELPPFARAVEEGLEAIMPAHVIYSAWDKDNPATFSHFILQDLLRKRLGFEGIVISDDLDMKAIDDNYPEDSVPVLGFLAGIDLFLVCHDLGKITRIQNRLLRGLEEGEVPLERVTHSVARILKLKQRIVEPPAGPARVLQLAEEHRALVNELNAESH
ncbi:MAG: beta-N-acetylhexosaminidase [Nitrospinae bacterium CG11_big_fil_rev_8_21_14_0_20_45_15]|nr:MAG: beta-N-acetylhexosaminidase [Nitrospinae bacterium CG11_big_fil_rev_8_21_14_0_20_45_15]